MNRIFLFIFILYQGILANSQQVDTVASSSSNSRPCSSMPCKNGALCTDQMTESISGYSCACQSGWSGLNCDIQKRNVVDPVGRMFGPPMYNNPGGGPIYNNFNNNPSNQNPNYIMPKGSPDEGLSQPFISGREDANDRKKKGSEYESSAYKNWSPEKDWARQDWPQAKWNQYNHDQLIGKNSWPSNDNHYYWPVGYDWWRWDNAYPHKSTAYPIDPYRTVPPVYPNTFNSYGKIYYGDGLNKTKIVAIVLGILLPLIAISIVAWAVYFFWFRKKRYRR